MAQVKIGSQNLESVFGFNNINNILTPILLVPASIGWYAIYKGFIGLKHYVKPDYPNPEDKNK